MTKQTTSPPDSEDEQLVLIDGMPGELADAADPEPAGPPPAPAKRGPGRPRKSAAAPALENGPRGGRPGRKSAQEQRAEKVSALYDTMGSLLVFAAPFAPQAGTVGAAMSSHSAALGAAWAQWAETSPRVRRFIDGLSVGGGAIAVLVAHVPILTALAFGPPPADAGGSADPASPAGMVGMLAAMMQAAGE